MSSIDTPDLHASTFEALFNTAPDAMIVSDAAGRIVLANPQAHQLFGYASTSMHGLSIDVLVPDRVRGHHHHHRAAYIAQPRVRPMGTGQELVGQRADGSHFPVEIALSPIESADGHFFVASIRDISETQRARQALARARYNALVAQAGRLVLESSGHTAAFEEILELAARELIAETVAIVFTQQQASEFIQVRAAVDLRESLREILPTLLSAEYLAATPSSSNPTAVRFHDRTDTAAAHARTLLQESGYADFVAVPLFDRNRPMGALIAASAKSNSFDRDKVHFLQSIANLLAAAVQRIRTEDQLAHVQRLDAIGQLTGGIAHDFNNLLTVISGNLQLLEIELADDQQHRDTLGSAMHAVGRGAELTRKLLAFARRQRLNPLAINPRHMLDDLVPILSRTLGEAIAISVDCAGDLPDVFVDPAELDTAILNLALNARDAMPRGGTLQISARRQAVSETDATEDLPAGLYVVIAVRDSGLGMAPDVLAHAFEPFFTTKETGRGSGLGLSMVYGFVKQSGGHLTADSRLGYGTLVELYLPAARAAAVAATARAPAASSSGNEKILVVEDEPEVRAVAVAFLRSLGYATLQAASAEQALDLLQQHDDIALLFSDVVLGSGMNGGDLARAALQLRPGLPTLLTSGYEHDVPLGDSGALPLLRKPYRREDLSDAVREALDRRS
jgi:PAS domain S-box-containing protein